MDVLVTTPAPGPLAEEAARLLEALAVWARGATSGISMPDVSSGAECQVCPLCQLLAIVRRTSPETFGHLVEASASVAAAMRTLLDGHDHAAPRTSGVDRINLDDEVDRVEPDDVDPPVVDPATGSHRAAK
jgi:hypothetical protein